MFICRESDEALESLPLSLQILDFGAVQYRADKQPHCLTLSQTQAR
jgi:hypothetical protein